MERNIVNLTKATMAAVAVGAFLVSACASAPETREESQQLEDQAQATVDEMTRADPSLADVLDEAYGYVVFPSIGSGGFVVGGAAGTGVVYQDGLPVGYATLREVDVGALAGGQTFSELIVFSEREPFERLRAGNFDLTANVSATAVQSGAAAQANFEGGTAVFVHGEAGLMAEASVGGQRISFEPMV